MKDKETVSLEQYHAALYTIGVLSNALSLAVMGTSVRGAQGDFARRENFITEGAISFEALTAEHQDQVIGMCLAPEGSVFKTNEGRLTKLL